MNSTANVEPFNCQTLGVSVVIATRNRPALLRATIESVLAGDDVPNEIVIVDQSDAPEETFADLSPRRNCHVRYGWSQVVGVARARNQGMALAHYDHLVLIDDDMLVTPGWLGALVRALVSGGAEHVVTGRVLAAPAEANSAFVPSVIADEAPIVYQGRVGKDVLYSGNMALHRQTLARVGGFDERLGPGTPFPAAEDNDFGYRLLEAGCTIFYAPEAALYHCGWRSEAEYLRLRWHYGVGRGAYYAKHSAWRDRYMLARMVQDMGSHLRRALQVHRYGRSHVWGDALLSMGMASGAARWWMTQRSVKMTANGEVR
jgi:GT2 family glycosyltransferase